MADADYFRPEFVAAVNTYGDKAERRIYAELHRRKRSKKAQQRLVCQILRRGCTANQGVFARAVCAFFSFRKATEATQGFLRDKMKELAFACKLFDSLEED